MKNLVVFVCCFFLSLSHYAWSFETPEDNLLIHSSIGQLEQVKEALTQGASVHITDNRGWTPLHLASSRGHIDVVQFLLEEGADLEARTDRINRTPLHLSSMHGFPKMTSYLVAMGADIRATDVYEKTPLELARLTNAVQVIAFFKEYRIKRLAISRKLQKRIREQQEQLIKSIE